MRGWGGFCCSAPQSGRGRGGRGGTHTGTHTGTYTRMLHLPFSDLPLKKCPKNPPEKVRVGPFFCVLSQDMRHINFFLGAQQGNPKGGLAKGGLARKAPIGPKRALSGQSLLFPRGCGVRRNWSRSAPKRPRQALKRLQSAPKRPDSPGRISPRFSLKIWGLSPPL